MESTVSGEPSAGAGEKMQIPEQQAAAVKMMKVMVAIDESDERFYALKWALDNLVPIKGGGTIATATATTTTTESSNQEELTMIYLVHVQQPFQHFIYPAGPVAHGTAVYATSTVLESVRKAQEENSVVLLSRALHMCKDKMVKAETLILDGDPKDMICQAAEQMHVDLLVVGSRGLGKIKRAFLGSVSDYCSHHAKCPILIVKPTKESKEFKESREQNI